MFRTGTKKNSHRRLFNEDEMMIIRMSGVVVKGEITAPLKEHHLSLSLCLRGSKQRHLATRQRHTDHVTEVMCAVPVKLIEQTVIFLAVVPRKGVDTFMRRNNRGGGWHGRRFVISEMATQK